MFTISQKESVLVSPLTMDSNKMGGMELAISGASEFRVIWSIHILYHLARTLSEVIQH